MIQDKLITIIICMALLLVFIYTNTSPLAFVFGASICLIIQLFILCTFCIYKFSQTYRLSKTITISRNKLLDPQHQYPYQHSQQNQQFYYNKFTQQANLFTQKTQLKSIQTQNIDKFYFEDFQIDQPRKNIIIFLKQIQNYYHGLNIFTDVLINFGKNLIHIEKGSIFNKNSFYFAEFQNVYQSEVPINELTYNQSLIFKQTNTKLQRIKGQDKLLFPSWSIAISVIKFVGIQYQKIQTMRQSNSQMLSIIHKKILQDFNMLQKKLINLGKQLNQTVKSLDQLKKDYSKYQSSQFTISDNNQPHLEMMHWFRKQFYAFRDLQRRIKENQQTFKQKIRQKQYYQQKICQFKSINQHAFMKTVKTRYIALLDSYYITVDQSIKKIQQSFYNHTYYPSKRPKVKNILLTKNLNQALQSQKQYQHQYFQRVQYFQKILSGVIISMQSINIFLINLLDIFDQMIKNLKICQENKQKIARYFTTVIKKLLEYSQCIYNQINQLIIVNKKMKQSNQPQLQLISKQISSYLQKSSKLLNDISLSDGPIKYKFTSIRSQLQTIYKQIQSKISQIQQFQRLYLLHSGRIKKIILTHFIEFLNLQKSLINIGDIRSNLSDNGYGFSQDIFTQAIGNQNYNEPSIYNQQDIRGDRLQTGYQLSQNYIKFLNQVLFIFYTQWKTSNFFKNKLQQQLFIAFNKDPNQTFSKIQATQLQFLGVPPQVVWIKQLKSEGPQSFFDIHFTFHGTIKFKVNTMYKLIRDIPVQVIIQIQQFYCVMRFCFVSSSKGKGWFSFIGQPISKFKIFPSIASYRIDLQILRTMFNNFLLNKLKKITYPIKQKISIPISKKDQDLKIIEKRFKAIQEKYQ